MVIDLNYSVDIRKGVMPQHVTQPLYYDDQNAHRINVSLYRGQQEIDLTGLSCNGYVTFVKDGTSIGPLVGEVSGNTCSVVLPHEAYYYPGAIRIEVKLVEGEEVTTVVMLTGQVSAGRGDHVIDIDGAVVPSLDALSQLISDMQDLYDELVDIGIETIATDVNTLKEKAVRVTSQTFTEAEKAQARTNIGAAENGVVLLELNTPDLFWVQGTLAVTSTVTNNGMPQGSNECIRTPYFDLSTYQSITITAATGYKVTYHLYDASFAWLSSGSWADAYTVTQGTARYARFLLSKANGAAITPAEYAGASIIAKTVYVKDATDTRLETMSVVDVIAADGIGWENGGYVSGMRQTSINPNRIRLTGIIDLTKYGQISISVDAGYRYLISWLDADGTYLGDYKGRSIARTNSNTYTEWGEAAFLNVELARTNNATITPSEGSHIHVYGTPKPTAHITEAETKISTITGMGTDFYTTLMEGATWEVGGLNPSTGATVSSSTAIRVRYYIPLDGIDNFVIDVDEGYQYRLFWYDASNALISDPRNGYLQTIPQHFAVTDFASAASIKITIESTSGIAANVNFADHLTVVTHLPVSFAVRKYQALESTALTVMSFNVQKWRRFNGDFRLIKGIIDRYAPDIICLQEFSAIGMSPSASVNIDCYKTLFTNYPYTFEYDEPAGASYSINELCIVSKIPFADVTGALYTDQTAYAGEVRGYIKGHIVFNGTTIAIFNTHLEIQPDASSSRTVRTAEAMELLGMMKQERYAICVGDFNCMLSTDKTGTDFIQQIKPFLDEGYHSANCSDQHGFLLTWFNGNRVADATSSGCLDQIITTSNIDIDNVVVDKAKDSATNTDFPDYYIDHFPIIAFCHVNG